MKSAPHSRLRLALLPLWAATLVPALAAEAGDHAGMRFESWPPRLVFANGTELAATGNYAYDVNRFDGEGYGTAATALEDDEDFRRKEFGVSLKRKGVYDFAASYDFHSDTWMDVALRVETRALLGRDAGKLRLGQFKLPVGFEGHTSTRSGSFLENALPTQAFYESRRVGAEWSFERPMYLWNLGYFFGNDLQGNNPGTTLAGRIAWTPRKQAGHVLHLGLSASEERPHGEVNGRGETVLPSVRWRARPEAALTDARLVDSGTLDRVDGIRRAGVEALWVEGPWSLQGEYLRQHTTRDAGLSDYSADGWYIAGSWLLTGESRSYGGGNVSNPLPAHAYGAWELLLRHSRIDLDNDGIRGGRQNDWTLGVNAYLNRYFRVQANFTRVDATRAGRHADPRVLQLRAQFYF